MWRVSKNNKSSVFKTTGEVRNRCGLSTAQVEELQKKEFLLANGYLILQEAPKKIRIFEFIGDTTTSAN